ncbi:MAG: RimK family alpha-L-glutamate ligase [Halanaeroarchaeum sp.]
MIRLAVASDAETADRIRDPLADRGIDVRPIATSERTLFLSESPRRDRFDVGYVYPGRLMEGGVVDARLDVPWINGRAAVMRSRNKAETIARLEAADVPVPETAYVSNPIDEAESRAVFERFDGPVVVKPNSATRGRGVVRVDDPDSFRGVIDYLDVLHDYRATGDRSYLVQEFLPGATDYRVMVIDGAYAGAVRRTGGGDPDRWKHNVHRGADATGTTPPADLRAMAERTAAAMDLSLVGVDLLVAEERAVVTETNARPTIDEARKYEGDFYDRLARLVRETAE